MKVKHTPQTRARAARLVQREAALRLESGPPQGVRPPRRRAAAFRAYLLGPAAPTLSADETPVNRTLLYVSGLTGSVRRSLAWAKCPRRVSTGCPAAGVHRDRLLRVSSELRDPEQTAPEAPGAASDRRGRASAKTIFGRLDPWPLGSARRALIVRGGSAYGH